MRGELLERARAATELLVAGRAPVLPAWQRFTGVVWDHLEPAALDDDARAQLLVPSGLLGLVAGTDPVPDHRLKLSVSLPGLGRLDRHWRPHVTAALQRRARGRVVVDLLPAEHAAAIDWPTLRGEVVHVRFVERDGAAVGHFAKAIKGRVARHVLDHGVERLATFRADGWRARRDGDVVTVAR